MGRGGRCSGVGGGVGLATRRGGVGCGVGRTSI
jgi:hypothetical protein